MTERLVVIDTNCLVQMISKRSPYRPIWDAFLGKRFVLCVSNDILDEYQEILDTNCLGMAISANNRYNEVWKSFFGREMKNEPNKLYTQRNAASHGCIPFSSFKMTII